MSREDTIGFERRWRMRYALLASAAGVLMIAAAIVQLSGPHTKVDELTIDLIVAHKRYPLDIIGAVINAFGLTAFALSVGFLGVCARARREEMSAASRVSSIAGGVLAAISTIVYSVVIADKAHAFVTTGNQTYEEAHHLTSGGGILVLPLLGQAGSLLLAIGVFFVALNAMRVGLLTRFMGYLGLFVGALVIFPIGSPVPVVQGFWLFGVALLLAGRWPSGMPAAWSTGRAEPWPSSAQLREQRAAGGRGGGSKQAPQKSKAPQAAVSAPVPTTRANTPKRKRKKRH
jgi:hypothetical protein